MTDEWAQGAEVFKDTDLGLDKYVPSAGRLKCFRYLGLDTSVPGAAPNSEYRLLEVLAHWSGSGGARSAKPVLLKARKQRSPPPDTPATPLYKGEGPKRDPDPDPSFGRTLTGLFELALNALQKGR